MKNEFSESQQFEDRIDQAMVSDNFFSPVPSVYSDVGKTQTVYISSSPMHVKNIATIQFLIPILRSFFSS